MLDLNNRQGKLTDAEFAALPRSANGDISTNVDVEMAMVFMTNSQVTSLSGDDSARYDSLQEELRCEMAAFGCKPPSSAKGGRYDR